MMPVFEAGGVVFRLENGTPTYLLIRPKKSLDEWLIPKGHIEPGESAADAAIREVREEAGVEAKMASPLGTAIFTYEGKELQVEFFLLKYVRDVFSAEKRQVRWSQYEEALKELSFPEAADILRRAHRALSTART